jgi:hypothetical protein
VVAMEAVVTAISAEVMEAVISAAGAIAACISAGGTTAVRGSRSHIHFHEAASVTAE